jgi:aryl-alcohol dehydrogenase-like predicted oxidoreductase
MNLRTYRPLGKSGLLVSPLSLGTMTFGTPRWGLDEAGSRAVMEQYVELGGNLIDTADIYSAGQSEEIIGTFVAERGLRGEIVLATKSGFSNGRGLLGGGNGARHINASLEASLKRLRTDFIDLYWIHVWDGITPADELLQTMANLIRAGKVRYWGISNTPAWYVAQLATLATVHGLPAPVGLQYFYSLADRTVESEHLPLAKALGMGLMPWSPLAYGMLTGKYDRVAVEEAGSRQSGVPNADAGEAEERPHNNRRLDGDNPFGDTLFTDRNWRIADEVKRIAAEAGETPARVALAWVIGRPGVTSTLMGVSRPGQVTENADALGLALSAEHLAALDKVSGRGESMLYSLSRAPARNHVVFGGRDVRSPG